MLAVISVDTVILRSTSKGSAPCHNNHHHQIMNCNPSITGPGKPVHAHEIDRRLLASQQLHSGRSEDGEPPSAPKPYSSNSSWKGATFINIGSALQLRPWLCSLVTAAVWLNVLLVMQQWVFSRKLKKSPGPNNPAVQLWELASPLQKDTPL